MQSLKNTSENSGSTFDQTKRIRLWQSLVMELYHSIPELLEQSYDTIREAYDHPYKQIREEVGRSLYFFISLCADPLCSKTVKGTYLLKTLDFVSSESKRLTPILEADNTLPADRGTEKPDYLCASEALLYCLTHSMLGHEAESVGTTVIECVPFMFAASKHPDTDLAALATTCLYLFYCSASHRLVKAYVPSRDIPTPRERLLPGALEALAHAHTHI
eukprot:GDKI01023971.1.p1 GENE.GDKI01023971.1~~GDKI01023971.1.p1  ORF type:complete len:250 (-),score=37.79 GDKI01023971.1:23-676(-)